MSNQPFSFPPPPPPPPKRNSQAPFQQNPGFHNNRGSSRGGHSFRANNRGGRGGYAGGQHASFNAPFNSSAGYPRPPPRPFDNGARRGSFTNAAQKRDHTAAFPTANQSRPRPVAPPAVPSFNASIEHLLPRRETPEAKAPSDPTPKTKKHNILGLTPASLDQVSDSEDDEGEEERLAAHINSNGQAIQIEYKGNVATLRTAEEIAAWIAERKKRYPTRAKQEAARKEAAEKKEKWEQEKKARLEAKKEAWARREQDRKERDAARVQQKQARQQEKEHEAKQNENTLAKSTAETTADKLRKRALKAERQLAKAKEALRLAEASMSASAAESASASTTQASGDTISISQPTKIEPQDNTPSQAVDDPDYTSSSGSSDLDTDSDDRSSSDEASDSDSVPEVMSTKQAALEVDSANIPTWKKPAAVPRPCKNMAKYGRCKYGSNCRFSHEKATHSDETEKPSRNARAEARGKKKEPSTLASANGRRKGLFQVMVEREEEEERRRLLEAIITLGEKGMLDEPAATSHPTG